jgi:hypothetical protein
MNDDPRFEEIPDGESRKAMTGCESRSRVIVPLICLIV